MSDHTYEQGRNRGGFWVKCSCGAEADGFSTSGMIAGWIANHDPRLRGMKGVLYHDE